MRVLPGGVRVAPERVRLTDGREVEGCTAEAALGDAPELAPELAAAVGAVARWLASVDGGPADGWRARFEAEVDATAKDVHARGLHLGPPLDRAVGPRSWPALDAVDRLALVHGDLGLHTLWVDPSMRPVAVLGLDRATPGDPLIDVAGLLRLADPGLRSIAVEASGASLDPPALARIGAYLRAGLLQDLLRAPSDPDDRAVYVEALRLRLDEPPLVARLIRGGPRRLEPDHAVVAARRALEASGAVRTTEARAAWLGALGAALLAVVVPGDAGHRLGLVARELASTLPATGAPAEGTPEPGFANLAHRGMLLLDEAVGAHVHEGLGAAASYDPALRSVLRALDAAAVPGAPTGRSLSEDLFEALADDRLTGLRAAFPAVVWAAQILAIHGDRPRADALLAEAEQLPR